jgi:hypothetical protein
MLRLEAGIWMLPLFIVNVPFYTMEINHILNQKLQLTVAGELGPVERKNILENRIDVCMSYSGDCLYFIDYDIFQCYWTG